MAVSPGTSSANAPTINAHAEAIRAALATHDVVIVVGETGSGKTTQLPQLLLGAGCERVVVTQPRRVAAIAAARWVASERGGSVGGEVGYAVRFEQTATSSTRITFVTDGVLLRQAIATPQLSQYDALVLDEAHERSLNTDVLFALAKRVLSRRRSQAGDHCAPLQASGGLQRVIIASATLDTAKLCRYFFDAPVLHVPGRRFPVHVVHAAEPPSSHALVDAALELVWRIHLSTPLAHEALPNASPAADAADAAVAANIAVAADPGATAEAAPATDAASSTAGATDTTSASSDTKVDSKAPAEAAADVLVFCTGQDEIATAAHALRSLEDELRADDPTMAPLLVLPMHATLPAEDHQRVFARTPHGMRKVVLATNVAETSLTIPGVRVVIDPGLVKEKRYDHERGMEVLTVVPISQSAATQRAGRAGRTAPGEVYRLYTAAQHERFEREQLPEIARTNLANVVLTLKAMGIEDVASLEWLDPPDETALAQAVRQLFLVGALDADGHLTADGRRMSQLPLEPSLSRLLLSASASGCAGAAATICAMACGEDPYSRSGSAELLAAAAATRERLERCGAQRFPRVPAAAWTRSAPCLLAAARALWSLLRCRCSHRAWTPALLHPRCLTCIDSHDARVSPQQ